MVKNEGASSLQLLPVGRLILESPAKPQKEEQRRNGECN